jgi:site-specific DNA-methyltransferase (adenine-specific)/site-specific DNA-methyltransferase (cytosine-N4-specific)
VTSPPYADRRKNTYGGIKEENYLDWFRPIALEIYRVLKNDGSFFLNIKEHTINGEKSLYVMELVLMLCKDVGFKLIDTFCWTKKGVPGRYKNRFKNAWEPVYHFAKTTDIKIFPDNVATPIKEESKKRAYRKFSGQTKNGSGFQYSNSEHMKNRKIAHPSNHLAINNSINQYSDNKWHPAVFPLGLPDFFIKAFSEEGDYVLDPFM